MKKSKILWPIRIAMIALALVCVSTFVVGYTFSKYVKSADNGAQTATVAKFGVTLSKEGTLFAEDYEKQETATESITYSVESSSTAKKLAPGTPNGEGVGSLILTATIENTSEVAIELKSSILASSVTGWEVGGKAYEPVRFTISKNDGAKTYYYDGTDWDSETAVTVAASQFTTDIGATEYVAALTAKTVTYTISWVWAYEDNTTTYLYTNGTDYATAAEYTEMAEGEDKDAYEVASNDVLDTIIGEAGVATLTVAASITATQIN